MSVEARGEDVVSWRPAVLRSGLRGRGMAVKGDESRETTVAGASPRWAYDSESLLLLLLLWDNERVVVVVELLGGRMFLSGTALGSLGI
jgi:hypothetical protein